ncbi:MAG: ribosome maturation factor RimM [Cyanobacteria bacterium P01_D01_bin.1]
MIDRATDEDWLLIGRIVGAHGINGHIKVYPESDFPERFTQPGERWIKKPGAEPTSVRLTSGRYLEGKNNYLVKLAGIDFRDQAEALRSAELVVPAGNRLPVAPGEFHVSDLIGLSVILQSNQTKIGTITDIFTTGHDLLEVTLLAEDSVSPKPEANQSVEEIQPSFNPAEHQSLRAKAAQKLRRKAKRQRKQKQPKTLLVPFVEAIVPVVNITSGYVEITPPEGLVELA